MQGEIAELRTVVEQLQAEIALLKGGRDSRTSSTAPSQDIGRSNKISLRLKSDRKPGGQSGHTGHTLAMSDTPGEIIEHYPVVCKHCGEDLQNVESASYIRRQIVDIPPISPVYTEHRAHVKVCPSCKQDNQGVFPARVNAPVQYGPNVEAMSGYLSVYQQLPYSRTGKLFNDFYGLNISAGTVDTFLENLSEKSGSTYESIHARIRQSPVVGADETGCKAGGKKYWFHVWQTPLLTFIVAFASRGYAVIEEYFKDGFTNSYYVSDCWASQLKVKARSHQLCMAHLLRELTNFVENLKSDWSASMKDLFLRAIALKRNMTENDYMNPPEDIARFNTELDELLKVDCSKYHEKEQAFVKRMISNRQSIFTFLTHPEVPPDNNASERAIRNVKVKTKVSGQFRNKDGKGADRYAKIRSVVDTTIKNGQDVYAAFMALANGKTVGIPE